MGKVTGRSSERRLANMSAVEPPKPDYYPPPEHECDPSPEYPIVISGMERVHGRGRIFRGRIVEFALTLQIRDRPGGAWIDIARVDCAHSVVHLHQFYRSGRAETRHEIRVIPTQSRDEDCWDVVDTEHDAAVEKFTTEPEQLVSTWRNG